MAQGSRFCGQKVSSPLVFWPSLHLLSHHRGKLGGGKKAASVPVADKLEGYL